MAYNPCNLSVLAYANGFTLWHYVTSDPMSEVKEEHYFYSCEMLRKGDMIFVNSTTDDCAAILVVREGAAGMLTYCLVS